MIFHIRPPHIERQNDHQHQATPQHPSIGSNTWVQLEVLRCVTTYINDDFTLRHPPPATTPPHPSTSSNLNTPHQSPATPQHPSVGSNTWVQVLRCVTTYINDDFTLRHPPPATTPPHPSTSSNLNTPHQAPATSHHPSTSSNMWAFVQLIMADIRNPGSVVTHNPMSRPMLAKRNSETL